MLFENLRFTKFRDANRHVVIVALKIRRTVQMNQKGEQNQRQEELSTAPNPPPTATAATAAAATPHHETDSRDGGNGGRWERR